VTTDRFDRAGAVVIAAVGLCLFACDRGAARGPASESSAASPPTAPAGPAVGATPLRAGRTRLRVHEGLVTLHANATPRAGLLQSLSSQLDFELDAPGIGSEPITIQIEAAPMSEVLPKLLPDRAYRAEYRVDPAWRGHRLARLEIAPPGTASLSSGAQSGAQAHVAALETSPTSDHASSRPGRGPGSGGAAPEPVDWKSLIARLDDADPDERIEALREIDPDGEGLTLITDRLARDPDPLVRLVAAEKLDFAETLSAVDALVLALNDPDPRVVLAAIDALEFSDDVSVVEDIRPVLTHPDEEVREAAADAIDFIVDDF
jgi:hypothetical protein